MKPEQLYAELNDLANTLGVQVSEQNFRTAGIRVKSGYCIVKGKAHCIIDKHLKLSRKVEALAECLSRLDHESVYVVPAVRDFLSGFEPKTSHEEDSEPASESTAHNDS